MTTTTSPTPYQCMECSIIATAFFYLTYLQETRCRNIILLTTFSHAGLYAILHTFSVFQPLQGSLSSAHAAEWRARLLANLNAALLIVGSVLCFLEWQYDPPIEGWLSRDRVWCYASFFASLFVGYLQWDLCWLMYHRRDNHEVSMMVHHTLFIAVTHYLLWGYYFKKAFAWLSFTELSTLFLNLRWFYAVSHKKDGKGYFWSSLLFAITFLLTRVLGYGLGLVDMVLAYSYWKSELGLHFVALGLVLGYALNVFWSVKVVQGVQRAIQRDNSESKSG